jgi:hypothetical protein
MTKLPDFILIGAGKCGTTSLFNYLNQHPQIDLCPQKETYFFLPESVRTKFKPWGAITDVEEYKALFANAPIDRVVGEISTTYYKHGDSAKIIHDTLPNVKIIAILRDPANRAFSDYQMHFRKGNETQDFSALITPDNRFVKPGFYYSELIPYFEIFEATKIKILFFDDLTQHPVKFIQDLFAFLEIDAEFMPDISSKAREGGLPKNQSLNLLLTQKNYLRTLVATVLKLFLPLTLRQKIRSNLIKNNIEEATLSTKVRKQLIEIYRSDILKLQELTGRDLSAWLE